MPESTSHETSEIAQEIYAPWQVGLGSVLALPFGGGWMLAHNSRLLGLSRQEGLWLHGSAIVSLLYLVAYVLLPPPLVLSLAVATGALMFSLATRQKRLLQSLVKKGYGWKSAWSALALILGIAVAIALVLNVLRVAAIVFFEIDPLSWELGTTLL